MEQGVSFFFLHSFSFFSISFSLSHRLSLFLSLLPHFFSTFVCVALSLLTFDRETFSKDVGDKKKEDVRIGKKRECVCEFLFSTSGKKRGWRSFVLEVTRGCCFLKIIKIRISHLHLSLLSLSFYPSLLSLSLLSLSYLSLSVSLISRIFTSFFSTLSLIFLTMSFFFLSCHSLSFSHVILSLSLCMSLSSFSRTHLIVVSLLFVSSFQSSFPSYFHVL